jgi:hypothetical protein
MNRSIVKILVIALAIFGLLGGIGSIVLTSYRVSEIIFVGDRIRAQVNEKLLGGSTITFPVKKIRDQLTREYPVFEDVRITRKLPATILIEPIFREGVAELKTQDTAFLLDTRGFIIDLSSENWTGPTINIDVPVIRLGSSVGDIRVEKALAFLRLVKDSITIHTVLLSQDGTYLKAETNGMEIYFSWDSDGEVLARTLQSLIVGFRIKGITPRVIDIRFSKPVYY